MLLILNVNEGGGGRSSVSLRLCGLLARSEPKAEWSLCAALNKLYPVRYIWYTLVRSSVSFDWPNRLEDQKAKARILHRLSQASLGKARDLKESGR